MDETILPLDHARAGQIIDDEIHDLLVKPLVQGVRLTAVFDSCHRCRGRAGPASHFLPSFPPSLPPSLPPPSLLPPFPFESNGRTGIWKSVSFSSSSTTR